jgi:hypothetical protein
MIITTTSTHIKKRNYVMYFKKYNEYLNLQLNYSIRETYRLQLKLKSIRKVNVIQCI